MSLSWKSVSNANGYKVRIYNCRKKKASSIHLSGRYNNNYYTNKSANTAYLVSVYSYRWVNGQRIYSIDSDAFVCTPRTLTTVSSLSLIQIYFFQFPGFLCADSTAVEAEAHPFFQVFFQKFMDRRYIRFPHLKQGHRCSL